MAKKIDDRVLLEMVDKDIPQKDIAEHFRVSAPAICQRLRKIRKATLPESCQTLTEKQKKFVVAMSEGATRVNAAMESFDCVNRESAKQVSTQLMKRDDIQIAISELMEQEGIGRRYRIRTLKRHIDNTLDPQASLKGVDIANKMENLYNEQPIIIPISFADLTDNARARRRERIEVEKKHGYKHDEYGEVIDIEPDVVEAEVVETAEA